VWRTLLRSGDPAIEPLASAALRAHRRAVLARDPPSLPALTETFGDQDATGPLDGDEARTFREAWARALAGDAYSLEQLVMAKEEDGLLDDGAFAAHVGRTFARSMAYGFRTERGYGTQDDFAAAVTVLRDADPDLAMRGFLRLVETFNENGLKAYAADWDRLLPTEGISDAVRAETAALFSRPTHTPAAKILRKLLARRGVETSPPAPPPLAALDATLRVGTDVACLVLGSYDAVERVSDQAEDLDDLPKALKKEKCLGFATGGDGQYAMRIVGRPIAGMGEGVTFPLVIQGDALTLSGVVGAGGTPTVPVPSGSYAAHVYRPSSGRVDYVVVLEAVTKLPKWSFGTADVPELPPLSRTDE
jgi:hypothetical protein